MAAQLSVRLLFLSGDEEGDGGDVDCCLGLWGCHLGCVAVRASVRTVPLFAGGLAFYEAVLAFSAAYFGVVVGGCFVRCGECGEKGGDGVVFRWRFCVFRGIRRGVFWSFWVGCAVICVFVLNGCFLGEGLHLGLQRGVTLFGGEGLQNSVLAGGG